jgi:ATP-dependent DNA ligase
MPEYKQQWKVQGSAKDPYTVSVTFDDVWSCSCVGWTRHMPRKDCTHIKKIKRENVHVWPQASPQLLKIIREDDSAPTAKSALKAGATPEQAAEVARVKREEVQAKKDAKLGKMRYGFQLAEKWHIGDALPKSMVAEVKYDGHLAMLVSGRIIARSGRDITNRFPEVSKIDGPAVIVGELIVPDAQGLGDFSGGIQARNTDNELKIRFMAGNRPAMFIAFDILEAAGEDITNLSLRQRRTILETFYRNANVTRHKLIEQEPAQTKQDILRLLERERAREGEGIMVKDLDASYVAKRGRNWLKVKTWEEREFDVVRFEETGIGDGFVIYIMNKGRECRVNCGSFKMREAIRAGHKRVEIKFLSESKDGALRFPSLRRLM